MEYALRDGASYQAGWEYSVLILILMEYALRAAILGVFNERKRS